jgi:tetratricopeptide (TPR) repeat protein
MKSDIEYTNRQIIPRWLPFLKASLVNVKSTFNKKKPNNIEEMNLRDAENEWEENKTISFAMNLVASYHILGIESTARYKDAVQFIIDNNEKIHGNIFFEEVLGIQDNSDQCCIDEENHLDEHQNIHKSRIIVRRNPNDALGWIDLAFFYVLEGNIEKAEKCVKIALSINNENYHIIRSAARFYVYRNNPEKALDIIRRSKSIGSNPLLLSSEISISEAFDLKSKTIKSARIMIADDNVQKRQLSELNATLATLEFNGGSIKKGKGLLQNALIMPNENTLAQAQYLIRKFDGNLDVSTFSVPCKYEADSWNNYRLMDFKKAVEQSERWFYYQPFSSRPAILYSYLQSLLFENYHEAIRLLDSAIKLSPNNFTVLNNKAVALIKINRIEDANKIISKLTHLGNLSENDKAVLIATTGLYMYRVNDIYQGRQKYKEAIDIFKKNKGTNQECIAYYYWYKEEELIKGDEKEKLFNIAKELADKYSYSDIQYKLRIE